MLDTGSPGRWVHGCGERLWDVRLRRAAVGRTGARGRLQTAPARRHSALDTRTRSTCAREKRCWEMSTGSLWQRKHTQVKHAGGRGRILVQRDNGPSPLTSRPGAGRLPTVRNAVKLVSRLHVDLRRHAGAICAAGR
ncbi:putative leader peptide [Streptomyces sp. NPDC048845]|uniref:putative leader peptide n=1 Tax=Streptomyces sp. NPDC048845 TaxID=3155390 RepID=UPI00341EA30E